MKPELMYKGWLIVGPNATQFVAEEADVLDAVDELIKEENAKRVDDAKISADDVYRSRVYAKAWRGSVNPDPTKKRGPFSGPYNVTEAEWDRQFRQPAPLPWTKDLPTEPGWYWHSVCCWAGKSHEGPVAIKVEKDGDMMVAWAPYMDYTTPVRDEGTFPGLWQGPITPPIL